MNTVFQRWVKGFRRAGALAVAAAAMLPTVTQAEPDYNLIGKQFSLVLQNAHFSRARFTQEMYGQFLECYVQTQDPQHLFLSEDEVKHLRELYATSFGDYLLANQTTRLAEELYAYYSDKALARISYAENLLRQYAEKMPAFDSSRNVPRVRRKLPRAANAAELEQAWRDQVEDMLLSEVLRRENVAKLAEEKGKPDPNAKEKPVVEKLLARLKRMRNDIQEADREDMVSYLLNAVAHVYDPHSDYMGAREEQRFKDMIKASIVGIGARLKSDDDGSTCIEGIVKGGPAAKCGQLKLGDRIVAVAKDGDENWTDIMFLSIDKVVDLIRGKKGQTVKLRVHDAEGGNERVVSIVRDEIPMSEELASGRVVDLTAPDSTGAMKKYRLGILTLPSFYVDLDDGDVHCAADVKRILRRMQMEGVQGIVLDLRFNGGGSLDEVRKMVGFFTGAGPVVQVKDSRGHVERLTVSGRPLFRGELVVIINKLSASASEIFAGAMVDYGRAVVVGDEASYGKGTVQVPRSLADYMPYFSSREGCGMIKVTTQKFYRVGGASTQLRGVPSDIVLPTATSGLRISEGEQDYALPYDEIPRAGGYVKSNRIARILPALLGRSAARVAKDPDLQYMQEDAARADERQKKNSVSLNKEERQAENAALLARKKKIDEERKGRYEKMAEEDKKNLTIYRLNLTDVSAAKLPIATKEDKNEFMDEVEDPEEELTETPEYPSNLDPVLRESLYIVKDMIDHP
ncbi:MAG: carboxy terminal-processing peptidase [Akkermansia sp.]|nr:carboxy terminal-processing peptidase [Akkermansia sp.]